MHDPKKSTVDDCKLISLPRLEDRQGNLTPVYENSTVPFPIARVYYLYDIPGGSARGGHAHRELQQLLIAVMGSFDIELNDGKSKKIVHLNRSYNGLLIVPYIWRVLENFSSGANCLVLCSLPYQESEYIRDFEEFIKLKER